MSIGRRQVVFIQTDGLKVDIDHVIDDRIIGHEYIIPRKDDLIKIRNSVYKVIAVIHDFDLDNIVLCVVESPNGD